MAKNKIKLGFEILLTVVILGMVYKLATNEKAQDQITDSAVENSISDADLQAAAAALAVSAPQGGTPQHAPKPPSAEQIQRALSPMQRGDFNNLNE